ncbi:hypothetical protein [Thomasclavelia cocleata]|jgi:hypothetical protein|uniref:hypothetical protein n=1 Tax=Thomasclavelia cocleata TaxID=69824 RepID=UPI00242B3E3E|nr:hypothetical protein [Thomasclavelia cocleata]
MARPANVLNLIRNTKGTLNPNYTMKIVDAYDIKDNSNGCYDMIYNAFVFGYAQGVKAQKKGCAYNG